MWFNLTAYAHKEKPLITTDLLYNFFHVLQLNQSKVYIVEKPKLTKTRFACLKTSGPALGLGLWTNNHPHTKGLA